MSLNQTSQSGDVDATGVPTELSIFLRVLLGCVSGCGIFGNVLTIVSIATYKPLRTAPNAYVVNLAIADIIVCSVLIPTTITFYSGAPNELLCQIIGYPNLMCLVVSIFNLSLVAINRYVVVCRSRDLYMKIYTKRNIIISCVMAWVIVAICLSPPLFGLGMYGYNEKFGTCIFDPYDHETYWVIFGFVDCTVIFPTMFVTLFCYVNIMLKFSNSQKKIHDPGPHSTAQTKIHVEEISETTKNGETKPSHHHENNSFKEKKNKESRKKTMNVIKSLFIIWITFLSCWMPLIMTYKIDYFSQVSNSIYHVLYALAQSNSTLNFIIYALTNRNFREAYKHTLTCGRHGHVHPI